MRHKQQCSAVRCRVPHASNCMLRAGDPKNKQLVTIGDKGRSQLSRIEADRFVLNVNETYKVKVTFPQVGAGAVSSMHRHGQLDMHGTAGISKLADQPVHTRQHACCRLVAAAPAALQTYSTVTVHAATWSCKPMGDMGYQHTMLTCCAAAVCLRRRCWRRRCLRPTLTPSVSSTTSSSQPSHTSPPLPQCSRQR
jgi:hypothetical protein